MPKSFHILLFLLSLFCRVDVLLAQAPPPPNDTLRTDGLLEDIFRQEAKFEVDYFHINNPKKILSYKDTLLDNYFHQPTTSRNRSLELINLGNVGTPQQQMVFEPNFRKGFSVGLNQFADYHISSDDLKFYKINNSFTDATFSQGRQQDDQYLALIFSRNFGDRVNFSLDFTRINHRGVFKNQKAQNTAFSTGIWYHHPNGSYDAFATITNNSNFQGHNGGIDLSDVNEVNKSEEATVPVILESTVAAVRGSISDAAAQTRYQSQEVAYAHYFTLGGPRPQKAKLDNPFLLPVDSLATSDSTLLDSIQLRDTLLNRSLVVELDSTLTKDSLIGLDSMSVIDSTLVLDSMNILDTLPPPPTKIRKPWKREFQIFHKISYNKSWFKFSDVSLAADSSFYGQYQTHNQGLRYFIQTHTVENTFRINTSKKDKVIEKPTGKFEVGLFHRLTRLEQEPLAKRTLNDLFLTGTWNYAPTPQLQLQTYAHYSIWNNIGDYYIGGDLTIDLGKLGIFAAKAVQQLYAPTQVQTAMYITNVNIWENDFSKTFETTLAATYRNEKWKTEVSGQYHLLNNYIYFDTLAQPQQITAGISIPQLIIKQNLRWKSLHLDNVLTWQLSSQEEVLPLPNLYGKHSLYLQGKIFRKVMLARFGIDVLWNSNYFPNAYQHLFGQFHLQDSQELGYYPIADIFFSMKVKTLRAFVKGENLLHLIRQDFAYQTPNHPIPYFGIRFGLSWRFLN